MGQVEGQETPGIRTIQCELAGTVWQWFLFVSTGDPSPNKSEFCLICPFKDPFDGAEPPIGPQPRIIGGAAVDPNEDRYPYFSLLWGGQGKKCGGVLITPSIVVTAAHVSRNAELVLLLQH